MSAESAEPVLYERRAALGLNALTREMIDGLNAYVRKADADPEVMVIGITGAGRGFCAGLDADYLPEVAERGVTEARPDDLPILFPAIIQAEKPVICAINGPAAGGCVAIALLSDMRFMGEGASLTTVFAKRGLVAEQGLSWFLPRIVGVSRALDLLVRSPKVGAAEALSIGLVDRVCPSGALIPELEAYAAELAETVAPRAVVLMKRQLYADLHRPMVESLWATDRLIRETVDDEDTREGVRSLIERRSPRFAKWPRR